MLLFALSLVRVHPLSGEQSPAVPAGLLPLLRRCYDHGLVLDLWPHLLACFELLRLLELLLLDHLPGLDDLGDWLPREIPFFLVTDLVEALGLIFLVQGHKVEPRVRSFVPDKVPRPFLFFFALLRNLLGVGRGPRFSLGGPLAIF